VSLSQTVCYDAVKPERTLICRRFALSLRVTAEVIINDTYPVKTESDCLSSMNDCVTANSHPISPVTTRLFAAGNYTSFSDPPSYPAQNDD